MNTFSIGVDLGGTNLRIAAVNQQGHLMEKVTLGTRVALGKDHVIHEMCDAIHLLTAKYRNIASLQGIGIGVPGIIDMKTGTLRESPNLPGLGGISGASANRAPAEYAGDSRERRQRRCPR